MRTIAIMLINRIWKMLHENIGNFGNTRLNMNNSRDLCAHHVITNIGMGIISAARSKYLRKRIAATAVKYKLKDFKLSAIRSQLRPKNQIQQTNGSDCNTIQRNTKLSINLKL